MGKGQGSGEAGYPCLRPDFVLSQLSKCSRPLLRYWMDTAKARLWAPPKLWCVDPGHVLLSIFPGVGPNALPVWGTSLGREAHRAMYGWEDVGYSCNLGI